MCKKHIASMVNGTAVSATPFGRGQIAADFEVTRRTLAGAASPPPGLIHWLGLDP